MFIALILIGRLFPSVIVQNKEAVLKRLFGVSDADLSQVKGLAQVLFMNIWTKDFKTAENTFNALFAKVFAWYSWMNFRRWIVMVFQTLFVGFGGLLGTLLLYNQNKLLTQQNELLTIQNTRLISKRTCKEAERRSALILLMGNLLDALDQELKDDIGRKGHTRPVAATDRPDYRAQQRTQTLPLPGKRFDDSKRNQPRTRTIAAFHPQQRSR